MDTFASRTDLLVPKNDESVEAMMAMVRDVMDAVVKSRAETLVSLRKDIDDVLDRDRYVNLKSGADALRLRLVQQASAKRGADLTKSMVNACEQFLKTAPEFLNAMANYVLPFIRDTSVVIVHGCGHALVNCVASCIYFRSGVRFWVAEGLPQGSGRSLLEQVRRHPKVILLEDQLRTGFEDFLSRSLTIVPDSSLASLMPETDLVLVGANIVTEHGGLAHSTGTLQLAIVAHAMTKPFYVLCETFKFSSIFPLSTSDLYKNSGNHRMRSALSASTLPEYTESPEPPSNASSPTKARFSGLPSAKNSVSSVDMCEVPLNSTVAIWPVELVPPRYIALIFSEEGIMPPSAVADQMLINRRALTSDSKVSHA